MPPATTALRTDSTRKPNEVQARHSQWLSPLFWRSVNTRSQPSLLWELGHFCTRCRRCPQVPPAQSLVPSECCCHTLHEILLGSPHPVLYLHSDLALTSAGRGKSHPHPTAAPDQAGGGQQLPPQTWQHPPHNPSLHLPSPGVAAQPAGPLLQLPGHMVTMGVTCCFF